MYVVLEYLDEYSGDIDHIYGPFKSEPEARAWLDGHSPIRWGDVEFMHDPSLPAPPKRGGK